jgi:hypothetical protein
VLAWRRDPVDHAGRERLLGAEEAPGQRRLGGEVAARRESVSSAQ